VLLQNLMIIRRASPTVNAPRDRVALSFPAALLRQRRFR
jgi:hypothetical protein